MTQTLLAIALGVLAFSHELIAHSDPYGAVFWGVVFAVWAVDSYDKKEPKP